ncbi:hypothetical protein E2C01_064874 [Portunus trituberculatus]|uniref:Uncharacterized protein n=1 Tax=Portunus trituberculatus TaxID=210409 RepID=A0A5B7HE82_PORTR|nr:hypothetical protein [Portunus trituberculatus]
MMPPEARLIAGRSCGRLPRLVFREQISAIITEETIIFLVITRPLPGSETRFLLASLRGTAATGGVDAVEQIFPQIGLQIIEN